jgi:hypothetical protein
MSSIKKKLTLSLPYNFTLNNHNFNKGTINLTKSWTSLKSFTINKRPNVFKMYNKRMHSHWYSYSQQTDTWPTVCRTHNNLTHGQLYSTHTKNGHMFNCVQYSRQTDTWLTVFSTHKNLTHGQMHSILTTNIASLYIKQVLVILVNCRG